MTGVEFDFSELNRLEVDLTDADTRVRRNTRKAVGRSAFVGKKLWAEAANSHINRGSLRNYGASIDYDIEGVGSGKTSGEIAAEIGPNLAKGQGPLGIVEETPGGVRGKPQRNREKIERPLTEDFVRGILAAVGDDGMGSDG